MALCGEVPTKRKLEVALPALQVKVTVEDVNVDPGGGLSITDGPVGEGVGVGVGVGVALPLGVGVGVAVPDGVGVGVAVGVGVTVGVGVGVGVEEPPAKS